MKLVVGPPPSFKDFSTTSGPPPAIDRGEVPDNDTNMSYVFPSLHTVVLGVRIIYTSHTRSKRGPIAI